MDFTFISIFRISHNPGLIPLFFRKDGMVEPHREKLRGIYGGIAVLVMVAGIVGVSQDQHIIQRRFGSQAVIADNDPPMAPHSTFSTRMGLPFSRWYQTKSLKSS